MAKIAAKFILSINFPPLQIKQDGRPHVGLPHRNLSYSLMLASHVISKLICNRTSLFISKESYAYHLCRGCFGEIFGCRFMNGWIWSCGIYSGVFNGVFGKWNVKCIPSGDS
ncbi:hypothetical protein CDAR_214491 [Caerostris darwini]|uniref:Uncharacterized protein n=1 Tax=Caerostris darwini TaxID=1538125 RepID=A0AAV4PK24_9ARAC|nr:hypothetical protein CDAR_214491 [Caerostris darwini]